MARYPSSLADAYAKRRGKEIKAYTLSQLKDLTPFEKEAFARTNVIAKPDSFFRREEKEAGFPVYGLAPYEPFAGLPYNKPEVYVRQRAISPKLDFGNLERFDTAGFITPEDVLPHEIGHVVSQVVTPKKHRTLRYGALDDEGFASSFDEAVQGQRRNALGRAMLQSLIRKQSPADLRQERFLASFE